VFCSKLIIALNHWLSTCDLDCYVTMMDTSEFDKPIGYGAFGVVW